MFGEDNDYFGWFFNNGEEWPRGQLSALAMMGEVGEPGAWTRVFDRPNLAKFDEPTVEGIEFPQLGIAQAWNDITAGALWVETYPATRAARGKKTTWRVTNLPAAASVSIQCDGSEFTTWRAVGAGAIEMESDVDHHTFRITTGFHGAPVPAAATQRAAETRPAASVKTLYVPASGRSGSCCD